MKQHGRSTFVLKGLFRLASLWISLGLSIVIIVGYLLSRPENRPEYQLFPVLDVLDVIEAKTLDLRVRLRGQRNPGDQIVIIAVDEKTEDELGRWHSSGRRWLAQMLDRLTAERASVVGFDFVLAEPDEGPVPEVVETITTHLADVLPLTDAEYTYLNNVKTDYDYDQQLTRAIQRAGNVVLGFYHFFNRKEAAYLSQEKRAIAQDVFEQINAPILKFPPGITPQPLRLRTSFGAELNLPQFSKAARSFGHYTLQKDPDGYVRKIPLLVQYDGRYCPALSLEIARAYLGLSTPPIIHGLGKEGFGSIEAIQLGKLWILTDELGQLLLNFYGGSETFPVYSLSDVILNRTPDGAFTRKIVLVGFTANIYQDLHSTAFTPERYYGVEVHATAIANILHEEFLSRPEGLILLDALMILGLGFLLGVLFHCLHKLRWELLTVGVSLAAVMTLTYLALLIWNIWLNLTFPILFILFDYMAITSYQYFAEEKQRRVIRHAFEHYVSPTVVRRILETTENPALGQEERIMSVMFSDIRGFTTISEGMSSKELTTFLEEYFTPMIDIVAEHGGTVDKYIGDAIMVFYGAPEEQSDHAVRACKTAVDMAIRVDELQVRWKARGLPAINIGIGINSGEMSVGNIGAKERFNYTILGDHVNLASRLEGANKQYGTRMIISQFTYDLIKSAAFTVRELDTVRVKGKNKPVVIYELLGYDHYFRQFQELAESFRQGLETYKMRQWDEATALFKQVVQKYPDDAPAKLYIERCQRYRWEPPEDDWDGVFEMKTK